MWSTVSLFRVRVPVLSAGRGKEYQLWCVAKQSSLFRVRVPVLLQAGAGARAKGTIESGVQHCQRTSLGAHKPAREGNPRRAVHT